MKQIEEFLKIAASVIRSLLSAPFSNKIDKLRCRKTEIRAKSLIVTRVDPNSTTILVDISLMNWLNLYKSIKDNDDNERQRELLSMFLATLYDQASAMIPRGR